MITEARQPSAWTPAALRRHLGELFASRDILINWTIRELRVRYADTRLGVAWLLVYPAAWVLLFTLLFGKLVPLPVANMPYPLFVMSGLAPWFFFSSTVSNSVSSLKNNSHLIPKVYFPREILIISSVAVGLVDLGVYTVSITIIMFLYGVHFGMSGFLLAPITLLLAALTLGVSLLAARLALFRRDVQILVPLAIQFLMYCVPIFYLPDILPPGFRAFYLLNPLTALIEAFREALVYRSLPNAPSVLLAALAGIAVLLFAYLDFKRAEPEFADRL